MTEEQSSNTNIKSVGYIRVSSPKQAKEGESLDTQKADIKKYCKKKGWDLIKIYADEGISGASNNRPELLKLLADAQTNNFNFTQKYNISNGCGRVLLSSTKLHMAGKICHA